MPRSSDDSSRTNRGSVVMTARLRVIGGKGYDAIITDISPTGCSIAMPGIQLRPDQRVAIQPETLEYLLGIVKSSGEATAIIEFDRPLYGPVVDHLKRRFAR